MQKKKKILVLDDEAQLVEPVLDRLEFYYKDKYIYCQTFSEALNALEKEDISCLSIDLIMPSDRNLIYDKSPINGINALRQIREKYADLPIACYTVIQEQDTIKEIAAFKAIYFCKKDDESFYRLFDFFKNQQDKR